MDVQKQYFFSEYFEGYHSGMQNYHVHTYYEISLILEGDIRLLLPRNTQSGRQCRLLLTAPGTPHCVISNKDFLYRRHNLYFSEDFLRELVSSSKLLQEVFGDGGRIVILSQLQRDTLLSVIHEIDTDANAFRQKLR